MRYFIHIYKTSSVAVLQLKKQVVDALLAGKEKKAIRIKQDVYAYPTGCGWYRIYGNAKACGRDLKEALRLLRSKINNLLSTEIDPMSVIKLGMMKASVLNKRKVFVTYKTVRGHKVAFSTSRAIQACKGLLDELMGIFNPSEFTDHGHRVSDNKLKMLQEKFS